MTEIAPFVFRLKTAVFFGEGAISQLPQICREYRAAKILILTDRGIRQSGLVDDMEKLLATTGFSTVIFDEVESEPGLETVRRAAEFAGEQGCGLVVALGGGSSIDTAKVLRVLVDYGGDPRDYAGVNKVPGELTVPLVAVPTTAGTGSEVSPAAVLSDWERRAKIAVNSPHLAPGVALVDPRLTVSCPPPVTAASGMDALGHAIEALVSNLAQPVTDALTLRAIGTIGSSLGRAVTDGHDIGARTGMALGSLLAGMAFAQTRLGLAHSLAAVLGVQAHVNHGTAVGLFLSHVMEYNAVARPEKFRAIAEALGQRVESLNPEEAALVGARAVRRLQEDIGLPLRLRDVGVDEEVTDDLVRDVLGHVMINLNPRRPTAEDVIRLWRKAW
ncbi:MAG: iron-containing alcohol dehydrogenase [Peptococcaceae bacterium]|nr:iron-containing alcohol dehydrogenase [Peptococcaceae bacterium]